MSVTPTRLGPSLELRAEFKSSSSLRDVFLVLELDADDASQVLLVDEVGRLEPRQPRLLNHSYRLDRPVDGNRCRLHLFVGGGEALHSEVPAADRERVLDRMVAKRMRGAPDGDPRPFLGPVPAYPESMFKSGVKGTANVRFRIRTTGAVFDPVAVAATHPAFGEAVVEAVRQWHFLPGIKNGVPVEWTVEMPVDFDPMTAPAKEPCIQSTDRCVSVCGVPCLRL
ncbi:MAG: hypothetical protein A3G75_08705 [Verrucomicrobia bacterium RIFCSPLOWO2_12_FULL_64_8]|nr:MAG: hypothetical protein A3G75_08705 [Verrucomicrobia bacterium RIFCSPLOWO2_12_FULL_64_8]